MGTLQGELLIYDSVGYNDQNAMLNGGLPPASPVSAARCATPYFGPSVIIYSGKTAVLNVFGQTITSNFGIIFLPSPYDLISFTVTPEFFSWIGK